MKTALFATDGKSTIKSYPYIRMSYMTTSDDYDNTGWTEGKYSKLTLNSAEQSEYLKSRTVYVLSDKQSSILPTNSVEVGWYNEKQMNKGYGLQMVSAQWSTHARATDKSEVWKQPNQVLPGGALYTLSTTGSETQVKAVTYSTLVDTNSRSWMTVGSSDYTVDSVVKENDNFIMELKDILENLRVVQWVNKDYKLDNAWGKSTGAVKIVNGGESLSNLGLTGKASTDDKYRLFNPTPNNEKAASEGDIDIEREVYTTILYKAFTNTEGDVYVAQATLNTTNKQITNSQLNSLVDTLKNTCGTNKTVGSGTDITTKLIKIGSKADTLDQILEKLKDSAEYSALYSLDLRTGLISNVVNAVTRNQGDDTLNCWVEDEKWYNEAFDGIYVVQQVITYKVGLHIPGKRIAVLDPKLCPSSVGQAGLFTNAHISQFRLDSKSTSEYAKSESEGYVGTFFGMKVIIPEMENMYYTRPFYIPNANVQDLT